MKNDDPFERPDTGASTRRDIARWRRREPGGGFWRSLALTGSVGWPIVVLSTAGAWLGRYADRHWDTGVRFTLLLLTLGTTLGCIAAYRTLKGGRR